MPVLPPYIIDPIRERFCALLPQREVNARSALSRFLWRLPWKRWASPEIRPLNGRRKLLRELLLWAAIAAVVGIAVGLLGTFRLGSLWSSFDFELPALFFTETTRTLGEARVAMALPNRPTVR